MIDITEKALRKVLKMAKKLSAPRFYTLCAIGLIAALSWAVNAVASLIAAMS